jgi:hypothetical protein
MMPSTAFVLSGLPLRYAVVLDFEVARKSTRGYDPFDVLQEEPNMIVRAGGVEPLAVYLDKARDRHNTKIMVNWHPYNRVDPDQPQTRIPFLAGDACIHIMARCVAVAPRNMTTSLRYLPFES